MFNRYSITFTVLLSVGCFSIQAMKLNELEPLRKEPLETNNRRFKKKGKDLRKRVLKDNALKKHQELKIQQELEKQKQALELLEKEEKRKKWFLDFRDSDGNTSLNCIIKKLCDESKKTQKEINKDIKHLEDCIRRYTSGLINTTNNDGIAPLEYVIKLYPKDNQTYWFVKTLVEAGANIDQKLCDYAKKESLPEVYTYLNQQLLSKKALLKK